MKILLVEPGEVPRPAEIAPSLEALQEAVGGSIQAVYPFDEPVALICHEEGKLLDLPLNRVLRDEDGQVYDIIAGTFFSARRRRRAIALKACGMNSWPVTKRCSAAQNFSREV